MFVGRKEYLELAAILRRQPAHVRPSFKAAAIESGHARDTIRTGWHKGWAATRDPRRLVSLPPLKDVCAAGTEDLDVEDVLSKAGAGAAPVVDSQQVVSAAAAPVEAESVVESEHAPAPNAVILTTPIDPIAAIAQDLSRREADALRASMALSANLRVFASKLARTAFDAICTPAGQARLASFMQENPQKSADLLESIAKSLGEIAKSDEKVFTMRRLASGESTSIQEHRVVREPSPVVASKEAAAALAQRLDALVGLRQRALSAPAYRGAIETTATLVEETPALAGETGP